MIHRVPSTAVLRFPLTNIMPTPPAHTVLSYYFIYRKGDYQRQRVRNRFLVASVDKSATPSSNTRI